MVDYNRLPALGHSADILDLEPLASKLEMFGWRVREADGHGHAAIHQATTTTIPATPNRPTALIFRTEKGKGASVMENLVKNQDMGVSPPQVYSSLFSVAGNSIRFVEPQRSLNGDFSSYAERKH